MSPHLTPKPIAMAPLSWRVRSLCRWLALVYAGWPEWVKVAIYGIALLTWIYVALVVLCA